MSLNIPADIDVYFHYKLFYYSSTSPWMNLIIFFVKLIIGFHVIPAFVWQSRIYQNKNQFWKEISIFIIYVKYILRIKPGFYEWFNYSETIICFYKN